MNCFEKQVEVDQLREENKQLRQKLRYRERKAEDGFFGSSTPSSKIPIKANTEASQSKRKRGAQAGHPGHSRKSADHKTADRIAVVESAFGGVCPDCKSGLHQKDTRARLVRDCRPIVSEEIVFNLPVERCPSCRKDFYTQAPGVFPKAVLGNQLLANAIEMIYLNGIPMGRACELLKISQGVLVGMLHYVANLFEDVPDKLISHYRKAPAKHADETGWRKEGKNCYAWLFATIYISIFKFGRSRAGSVAREVFGDKPLPGVLVVDRYGGYNKVPCAIQYCYAHLFRDVQDVEKEFPDNPEIKIFVSTVAPLLAMAMGLRTQQISDTAFKKKAASVKKAIQRAMDQPSQHAAIRKIQDIFTDNEKRMYHWAKDRRVPAENNRAERDLRPTVIARKTSFGSQSEAGAETRGILMSVIHTIKKQRANPAPHLKSVLDALASGSKDAPFKLLFPGRFPA